MEKGMSKWTPSFTLMLGACSVSTNFREYQSLQLPLFQLLVHFTRTGIRGEEQQLPQELWDILV